MPLGKYFFFRNPKTDLVMGVEEGLDRPGVAVVTMIQRPPTESRQHQLWYQDVVNKTICSKMNSFCLDVKDNQIIVHPYRRQMSSQRWRLDQDRVQSLDDEDHVIGIKDGEVKSGSHICLSDLEEGDKSQQWQPEYINAEYFYIRSQTSNKVLDVQGAKKTAGTLVVVYPKNREVSNNQLWYEDRTGVIRSRLTDFAFTGSGGGEFTQMRPYDPKSQNQQWVISGNTILNRFDPDDVMDFKGGGIANKFRQCLISTTYTGSSSQLWFFDYLRNQELSLSHSGLGKYMLLRNICSGRVLTASATTPGSEVVLVEKKVGPTSNHSTDQMWSLESGCIRSAVNNLCLAVKDGCAVIDVYNPKDNDHAWQLVGTKIQNCAQTDLVLKAKGGDSEEREIKVKVTRSDGDDDEAWMAKYLPARCFFLKSAMHGKVLDVANASSEAGTKIIVYQQKQKPENNQLWYEDEQGIIRSKLNGFVIDATGKAACTRPYDPTNNNHQWILLGESICNLYDNKLALDIEGTNKENGACVIAYPYHGKTNQQWIVQYV